MTDVGDFLFVAAARGVGPIVAFLEFVAFVEEEGDVAAVIDDELRAAKVPLPQFSPNRIGLRKADFFVRSRVRKLFEEWKRRDVTKGATGGPEDRTKGNDRAVVADMSREFEEIRRYFYSRNVFSYAAITTEMKAALSELGVAQHEVDEVYRGIVGEAKLDEEARGREERKDR